MNAFIWIFLAFAAGLMLFSSLQEQLPDELGFLKSTGTAPLVADQTPAAVIAQNTGWTLKQSGNAIEFSRPFEGTIVANGEEYDSPEIGILCNNGKLDLRLDSRITTTGLHSTPVTVSGMGAATWEKGTGKNLFPADAHRVLRHFAANRQVSVTLSYASIGSFSSRLDTSALPRLLALLPESCR